MKKKYLGLIGLIPSIMVPFVVTNCSTISNNESKEENKNENSNDENNINSSTDLYWNYDTNYTNLSSNQLNERQNRFNEVQKLYTSFSNIKNSSSESDKTSEYKKILEKFPPLDNNEENQLISEILAIDNIDDLRECKDGIKNLYNHNKIEYCFISYSNYKNKIESWWNKERNIKNDFEKEKSYCQFLIYNSFLLPSFGYIILSGLINSEINNTENTKQNLKDFYNELDKIFDGNSKSEIEQYKNWIFENNWILQTKF